MKKKVSISSVFAIAICVLSVFGFMQNFDLCIGILGKATVMSASTVLPVGLNVIGDKHDDSDTDGNNDKENNENTDSNSDDDTTQKKKSTDKKNTTEKETSANTVETPSATSKEGEKDETDFTATPDDIKTLMASYEKKAKNDKNGGSISEQTYKTSGVTNSYGNVRIKNINDTSVNIKKILNEKADLSVPDKSKPSVLIFHTHTTERYQILDRDFYAKGYSARSEDPSQNMVRVGDAICEELENAGYTVIHDTNIYDKKYNGAYSRSREQIEKYLEEYPSIQVVLDIHRDAIQLNNGTKIKPVATVKGKKCAQLMIISGCQESGNGITGFDDWRYNLTFAVQLQNKLETLFSGITRPLYFCPRKYNMDTSHCSVLVEVGSDANTLEEAVYAGKCLGVSLAELMNEYAK